MATESKAPRALAVEKLGPLLETKLEDELLVLSSMIQAMSKGELTADLWEKLHEAALRDDRLVELAAAYEEVCHPRMIRRMSGPQQSELLFHAAEFLHRTLEDTEGAEAYLERAVSQDPGNKAAFDLLENLLIEAGNGSKLCELYVSLAGHQADKDEQARLLKRAAELAEVFAEEPPKLIAIHEKLIKLDPQDPEARRALEGLYRRATRWSELARLLEQGLPKKNTEDEPESEQALETRSKLIDLYLGDIQQPERALSHIEEMLRSQPASETAREGARKLLSHKMLGARAALALESAHEREGEHEEVVRVLGALIESSRGPQRIEAQKRLGAALFRAGNVEEAFPVLEKALFTDASDEDIRQAFRQAGARLDRLADVAKGLLRCASTTRHQELKVRLHLEAGEALLESGDTKKAIPPLQVASESDTPEVRLPALRSLLRVTDEPQARATLLTQLAQAETSEDARSEASALLGELLQEDEDSSRAIAAWRGALGGKTRERAERALTALYERAGAWKDLVELLLAQAQGSEGDAARTLLERVASIRQERLSDLGGALAAWGLVEERFGRSPAVIRHRRELLDKLGRHGELVAELVAESSSGASEARGGLWGIVAQLRLERLNDTEGALAASQSALRLVPGEAKALAVAMKLLDLPGKRQAAEGLEGIFREQADFWGLVRVLEVLGMEAPDVSRRLAALGEAVELIASDDPQRALRLAQEGLALSLREDLESAQDWLVRLELLSGAIDGPGAHASLLLSALGERELSHPALIDLARRASASLVEAKRTKEALPLLKRIFEADPRRVDVAPSVDRLLLSQGDVASRVELWQEVLRHEQGKEARIEALRLLSGLAKQRGDEAGAVAALGELLSLAPTEQAAWLARIEGLRALGRREELATTLEQASHHLTGNERRAVREEQARLAMELGDHPRAIELLGGLLSEGALPADLLIAAEREATSAGEQELLLRVLKARIEAPGDADTRIGAMERLASLLTGKEAAEQWKKAAQARVTQGRADAARTLYERALEQQDDPEALRELTALAHASGDTKAEAALLLRQLPWCKDAEAEVALLCALVPLLQEDVLLERFEEARSEPRFVWSPELQIRLLASSAKAFEANPTRRVLALASYRALIELGRAPESVAAFEAMLASWPQDDQWREARRWGFSWRAEHDPERASVLLVWAQAEEEMGDDRAAVELYRRLLVLEPASEAARERIVPLLLRLNDVEGARGALLAQRARARDAERRRIDLQLAALLIERSRRFEEGLGVLEPLLDLTPGDDEALRIVEFVHGEARHAEEEGILRRAEEAMERAVAVVDPARALALLERLLAGGGSPEQRHTWHQGLIERAPSPEESLRRVLRAASETPLDGDFWEQAEQLARRLGQPGEVIEAYRTHLDNTEVASAIGQRAINFYEEWFEEPEGVIALVERVLLADVEAQWAFDRLKVFYGADERWGDLLSLYERMIQAARSDDDRQVFLEDAVEIARDFAGDDNRAIRYLEHLVQLRPEDETLTASLERLYERNNHFASLIGLLERQLSGAEPSAAQRTRGRIAALWLDGVGDPAPCFSVLQRMLDHDAEDQEALGLLERMLATFQRPAPGAVLPEALATAYRGAAVFLKARYQQAGRAEELVRVLEIELHGATSAEERARLLRESITLRLSTLQDLPGAFDDTTALLALEPDNTAVLGSLWDLAQRTEQPRRLLDVLDGLAAANPAPAPALLIEAARVAAQMLKDDALAIEHYQRAIRAAQETKAHSQIPLASRELVTLLEKTPGQERTLFDALHTQLKAEQEPEDRAQLAVQMASLAKSPLADPSLLALAWELRRNDAPLDPNALAGLIDAYDALARWPDLVSVLQQRSASIGSPEEQRADLLRAAEILEEQERDPAGALTRWEEILKRFGDTEQVSDTIARLLERLERFEDLGALLQDRVEQASDPKRKASLLRKLAAIQVAHLQQHAKAVSAYATALTLEPGNAAALAGLKSLSQEGAVRQEATSALLAYFQQAADAEGISSLLDVRLELADDDDARVLILLEVAGLLEEKLARTTEAFGLLRRALALAPSDLGLARETLRVARGAGLLLEGVASLQLAAEAPPASAVARSLWLMIAEALRLVDAARADKAYEQALSLGEDPETLRALVELRRAHRTPALVDALLRLATALKGAPELLLEAGQVALEETRDPALTRQIAHSILEQTAAQKKTWASWEPAANWAAETLTSGEAQLEPSSRAEALRKAIVLPFDAPRRITLLRRLAELCEQEKNDLDGALQAFQQLLEIAPEDQDALGRVAEIFRRLGRREDLIRTLHRQITLCPEPEQRSSLRLALAGLLQDTGDADAAIQALREALGETPGHEEAATLLGELYEATGRLRELTSLLETRAGWLTPKAPAEAARLWAQAASLAEARLKEVPRAIQNHRNAAELGLDASLSPLARLLLGCREYAEAATVLERIAARAQEPHERSAALASLAEAYAADGRKDNARRTLEQAIPDAQNPTPLQARLIELYREAEDWGRLAELMVADARSTQDVRLRAARLREAAELLLERQADPGASAGLLKEAAGLLPEDVTIQLALGESLRLAGSLEEASVVLRKLIDSYGMRRPKERALAHLQLGLLLHSAQDAEGALSELDTASRIDPAHPRILQTLGRIAIERGELERAQKALRSLLLLLPRGARGDHGVSRVEVQLSLADIARRQGDNARADELLESTLAHARESEEDWALLDAYFRENGHHGPLSRSLEMRVSVAPDSDQLPLLRELTSLYLFHLEQPALACERARRALALEPERHEIRQLAVEAARSSGDIAALQEEMASLASGLANSRPTTAAELWLEIAELSEVSEEIQAALERAEQCASTAPDPGPLLARAWPRLEELLGRTKQQEALAALLLRRRAFAVTQGDSPQQIETTYRLATLQFSSASSLAEALGSLREALALEPQIERTAELLLKAVQEYGDDERVLRFYEQFSRDHGRTQGLIDALTRLGGLPSVGTAPLREAAELTIRLGDERAADAILREITQLDQNPSSLSDVIWALVTLAERVQTRGDIGLAASLKERAAELADPDERAALLLDVAALARGPLMDNARAAKIYETLLEQRPAEPALWRPLAEIFRASEDDGRLVALFERILPLVDGQTRAELRGELIDVLLRERAIPGPEGLRRAIMLLQDALSDSPGEASLTARLAELLERTGDQQQLAELLEQQLDAARDRGDYQSAASLALRLGALYEQLALEPKAIEFYRVGLDVDPSRADLLRAILKLVERREDSFETAELLERLLRLEKGPPAAEIALRLAALHEANWNPEAACNALELGYEACPDTALRDQLSERYTEDASWEKLAALFTKDAEVQASSGARIASLRKAAEVQRKHLNNAAASADLLQQAFALAPSDRQVLQALLDALLAVSTPTTLRRAIDALSFALDHRNQDPELLRHRGELHAKTGAFEAALSDLEASSTAGNTAAAAQLKSTLQDALRSTKTPATLRPWRLRIAALLQAEPDIEGARAHLEAANRDEPNRPEILRAIVALERKAQRWDALLAPLKTLANSAEGSELNALAGELADAAKRAGKPAEARAPLERALRATPTDTALRSNLRAIYEATGARRELAQLLREDADLHREPGPRFEALLAAARLLIDPQQGDPRLAAQILDEARAIRPEDLELALLLAETHVNARRPRDAIQVLDRVTTAHRGRRSKPLGQVYLRKAQLELSLGERPNALVSLGKAFDNDSSNGNLAMELGLLALEMNDEQSATRAFRAISLMKVTPSGEEGTTAAAKAQAYYQLSLLALGQADRRKARLLAEKAVTEDPSLEAARLLRDELVKNG